MVDYLIVLLVVRCLVFVRPAGMSANHFAFFVLSRCVPSSFLLIVLLRHLIVLSCEKLGLFCPARSFRFHDPLLTFVALCSVLSFFLVLFYLCCVVCSFVFYSVAWR